MNLTILYEKIFWLFVFAVLAVITNFIAKKVNFFSIPHCKNRETVTSIDLFVTFSIYLVINFITLSISISSLSRVINISYPTVSSSIVFIFYLITMLLLLFYYKKRPPQTRSPFTAYKNIILAAAAFLVIYPTALFTSQLLDIFNLIAFNILEPPRQTIVDYLNRITNFPIAFFLTVSTIVVIAPISEEIIFRGYLQTWLKKILGKNPAIFLASFLFAVFHFSYNQSYSNITIIISLFVVAIYFGVIYERQKSLLSPIIAHMIFNAVSTINILLSKEL
jgi:uncharacterized protein